MYEIAFTLNCLNGYYNVLKVKFIERMAIMTPNRNGMNLRHTEHLKTTKENQVG